MAWGKTNIGGGEKSSLNLQVIASDTIPLNPKQGTIWIQTSVKIPNWIISPDQPTENLQDNTVWISTKGPSPSNKTNPTLTNLLTENDLLIVLNQVFIYNLNTQHFVSCEGQIYNKETWRKIKGKIDIVKDGKFQTPYSSPDAISETYNGHPSISYGVAGKGVTKTLTVSPYIDISPFNTATIHVWSCVNGAGKFYVQTPTGKTLGSANANSGTISINCASMTGDIKLMLTVTGVAGGGASQAMHFDQLYIE